MKPGSTNPCRRHYLTSEVSVLFSTAKPEERGVLALAVFLGLRPYLLERLPAGCVDVKQRRVCIPSTCATDRHPKIISTDDFESDLGRTLEFPPLSAMWSWLESYPHRPRPWSSIHRSLARSVRLSTHGGLRNTAIVMWATLHGWQSAERLFDIVPDPSRRRFWAPGVCSRKEAFDFYALTPSTVIEARYPHKTVA